MSQRSVVHPALLSDSAKSLCLSWQTNFLLLFPARNGLRLEPSLVIELQLTVPRQDERIHVFIHT